MYVSQRQSPGCGGDSIVFCFETSERDGDVVCDDPDSVVFEARFFSAQQAVAAIGNINRSGTRGLRMREPLVAYLSGEAARGTLWLYRDGSDGTGELVARVPSDG